MKLEIIAEVGKNFIDHDFIGEQRIRDNNYYLENAKELSLRAKESGATVVKFQTHVLTDEQFKRNEKRHFWINFNEFITSYSEFWLPLKGYCDEIGIEFLTTPMSKMAAIKVDDLVKRWKVSSADIVDFELLEYLKSTGKPIILSTGMSTPEQIEEAVSFLGEQIEIINYCVSLYPCHIYEINLTNLIKLSGKYDIPVGFSDHSLSLEVPALAVRMGVVAVEKHFTLNRNSYGPDHKVSLQPIEFEHMAELCKLAEKERNEGGSFEEEKIHWNAFRKVV